MAETLIIALFAVVVGIIAGYILAQVLGHTVFSASIGLRAQVIPLTVILSLLVALIAAALPTYRAVNIEPAKVLKGE
ncbi:FtsX-like permease family protein [compost metagenome]